MARLDTSSDGDRDVARDETSDLISSDKVEGTAVYGADGDKIGRIESVMIGKRDGKVAYAVLSFGGFLGMGEDHYPIPWSVLTYDENYGGYRVSLTEDQLKNAPSFRSSDDWDWDTNRRNSLSNYYGQGSSYPM